MVAILVLATFIAFVVADYYWQTRKPQPAKLVVASKEPEDATYAMSTVGGFKLPAHLAYHPGHAWALKESRQVVRIGLDDFAARLIGHLDQIQLPARGRWLRQGERAWTVTRGNHRFDMLSSMEGEVVDVNEEVLRDPTLVHNDPYGTGWLLAVNAPAGDANLKNLLHGRLAHHWMEECVATLHTWASPESGAHLQDGGHAVPDILSMIPEEKWERLVHDAFLA